MENKFKKGLILGGLLAAVATIGLVMSKEGQELSEDLQKDLKTLAKRLKKRLHQLEDVTRERFNDLVMTVVEEYSEKMELTKKAKEQLINALKTKWDDMEGEYKREKDDADKEE